MTIHTNFYMLPPNATFISAENRGNTIVINYSMPPEVEPTIELGDDTQWSEEEIKILEGRASTKLVFNKIPRSK